ncbi:MAG: Uma2 family endonuclease [Cyanobacteria bacterium P01_E01_bin.6]
MSFVLDLHSLVDLTHDQFEELCRHNRDVRLERTATGELVIMPPTGGETGKRNSSLVGQLWLWNQQSQLGETFDSSTGFTLPNGATRSPDAAWIQQNRWDALTPDEKRRFLPLCPDFAIELVSPSDSIQDVRAKMREYLENGLQLGWLIDPNTNLVEVYQPDRPVNVLQQPRSLSADPVLPGFILELSDILSRN